jgi:hypothetical protein
MVDVEYVDELIGLLDAIAHSVFATTGAPLPFERFAQWSSYSFWILGQRPENELDAGCRGGFREVFGKLTGGCPGHSNPEAH